MDKVLFIRTDANYMIATGHMMRCLAIADAVRKKGGKVKFITADQCGSEIVDEKGYEYIQLDSKWNDLDIEIDKMLYLIQTLAIQSLLIDTYYVTERYLSALKEMTCITYIDDLNEWIYPCHRLINYAVHADADSYESLYPHTKLLLGCKFSPLRGSFSHIPVKTINTGVANILILTGGADKCQFIHNFILQIAARQKYSAITFEIICGRYCEGFSDLEEISKRNRNIHLHKNIENMDLYMRGADIAVSAGGTALYELCACGTPTICYASADNQLNNVRGFHNQGVMYHCGDVREGSSCFNNIEIKINEWISNQKEREVLSQRMQRLVDGKGAFRIAEVLIEI